MEAPLRFEIRPPRQGEALGAAARWIWLDHCDFYGIFIPHEAAAIRGIEELLHRPESDLGSCMLAERDDELLGVMCYFPLVELSARSLQSLRRLMIRADDPGIARQKGRIFAGQVPKLEGTGLYLARIAVVEHCQGMGVGSGLIRRLEELGRAGGHSRICLHVHRSNRLALRLYEKHGYSPCTDADREYLGLEKRLDNSSGRAYRKIK